MSKGRFCPWKIQRELKQTGRSAAQAEPSTPAAAPATLEGVRDALGLLGELLVRISQISTFEAPCQPASSVLTATVVYGATGHQMARHGAVWCTNAASRIKSRSPMPVIAFPVQTPVGLLLEAEEGCDALRGADCPVAEAILALSCLEMREKINVRRSLEQLASLVPQGEKVTNRTSSVCS